MRDEHPTEDRTDAVIRAALRPEPQPKLSPFFAARFANIAKAEQNAPQRRMHPALAVYWFLLLAVSIWTVGGALRSDLGYYTLLALVPVSFVLPLCWRRVLTYFDGVVVLLFGR